MRSRSVCGPQLISISVATDRGRAVGSWRVRPPTAREALAVLACEDLSPEASQARLAPILRSWWPLSMSSALLSRQCRPALALSTARWIVVHGVPDVVHGSAKEVDASPDWDMIAVEVRAVVGITLDEPWPDWIRAASCLGTLRARDGLASLAWYAAAKSTDEGAYHSLVRRAGYAKHEMPRQTPEEGLAAMKSLKQEWTMGVA